MHACVRIFVCCVSFALANCSSREAPEDRLLTYRLPPAPEGTVLVLGFVKRQGQQKWHVGMSLRNVIANAGGYDVFADKKRIRVITSADDYDLERKASFVDLRVSGSDYPVRNRDVIVVEEIMMEPF